MLSKGGGGWGHRGFGQDITRLLVAAGDIPKKCFSSRYKEYIPPSDPCSWRVPTPSPSQKLPHLIIQLPWELNKGKRTATEVQEIQIPYKGLSESKVKHRFWLHNLPWTSPLGALERSSES